ncbi:hypothetical protein K0M31_007399 [Melipona bicolor]|uniref:Uncharacterized protein n=1 Tax=Melipona bicolor TaxID=60889 RepID=A0AA40GBB7_9HYME|nr:hypothetical protein K0M31_007399 [Melipona bicolor]
MTDGRPKCALIKYSFPPGNDLMNQVIALCSGEYLTLPMVVLNLGESASLGTGITISTLLAVERLLNCDLALSCIPLCYGHASRSQIQSISEVLRGCLVYKTSIQTLRQVE